MIFTYLNVEHQYYLYSNRLGADAYISLTNIQRMDFVVMLISYIFDWGYTSF